MLFIDGSQGEGGGQILRTSLTLACLTQTPIQIINIRARRPKPGLQAQHLQAVRAATAIARAKVSGDHPGSQSLYFEPDTVHAGAYQFDIGTAGATTLVLQTVFLPLCFADGTSHITITGGTHVPWSPAFHYLDKHWLPCLREMGAQAILSLDRAGFYPRGGGQIRAKISPIKSLTPLQWTDRGRTRGVYALSGAANLPAHILQRQRDQVRARLGKHTVVEMLEMSAPSPGTFVLAMTDFETGRGCFVALGKKGKPAEAVADEAVNGLERFSNASTTVDEHLADQLLLPLALTHGNSEFITHEVTRHLLTNAAVIEEFKVAKINIYGKPGSSARVEILPY